MFFIIFFGFAFQGKCSSEVFQKIKAKIHCGGRHQLGHFGHPYHLISQSKMFNALHIIKVHQLQLGLLFSQQKTFGRNCKRLPIVKGQSIYFLLGSKSSALEKCIRLNFERGVGSIRGYSPV